MVNVIHIITNFVEEDSVKLGYVGIKSAAYSCGNNTFLQRRHRAQNTPKNRKYDNIHARPHIHNHKQLFSTQYEKETWIICESSLLTEIHSSQWLTSPDASISFHVSLLHLTVLLLASGTHTSTNSGNDCVGVSRSVHWAGQKITPISPASVPLMSHLCQYI